MLYASHPRSAIFALTANAHLHACTPRFPLALSAVSCHLNTRLARLHYQVRQPSGIALDGNTLYVGSFADGTLHTYDTLSRELLAATHLTSPNRLAGLAIEPDSDGVHSALYYTDGDAVRRVVVADDDACPSSSGTSRCSNNVIDGDETDVDCGGAVCARCAETKSCQSGADCASAVCTAPPGTCAAQQRFMHTSSLLQVLLSVCDPKSHH